MPFGQRSALSSQNMVTNWSQGVQRSGAKWAAGAAAPRRAFNANPTAAAASWANGVAAAQNTYEKGLQNVNVDQMIANINGVGQQRYSQAGAAKVAKFQAKAPALISAINAAVAALPADRSTVAARITRSTQFQTLMHANKGKI